MNFNVSYKGLTFSIEAQSQSEAEKKVRKNPAILLYVKQIKRDRKR